MHLLYFYCCSIDDMIVLADELPVRGFIGHLSEEGILPHRHKMYLYTKLHFMFQYNGENVSDDSPNCIQM